MSPDARFVLDPAFVVGDVAPRLFGSFVAHSVLTDPDPDARNPLARPERVTPAAAGTVLDGAVLRGTLPALSWNRIRLA
ncbi:hypothetical protein [Streptomyces turgidiscabies]|uniref:Alpha-L-arabinofuranosidase n=1 Tax=Streptomyces turgidiscabies TaxID=85558 RepID=A0ABU0RNQ8_9ACTN|nr:hypothetical protein [Streptomyces turgidiscabies]MDQ0933623.1 alpha-L-arabinofuranosidase [Streptomyces turgidiscabies]